MTRKWLCIIWTMFISSALYAQGQDTADGRPQIITDSLANDFHSVVARNFSRYRTINMYWEMKAAHNYTFAADGKEIEKGRKRNLHTLRFSTMIPVLKQRRFSLYANVQYASYVFDTAGGSSAIFSEHSYNHYSGGFTASYLATLFNRHFYLSARAGVSTVIKGALYTKSRKELSTEMEQKRSPTPFFNVGVSYSLFK